MDSLAQRGASPRAEGVRLRRWLGLLVGLGVVVQFIDDEGSDSRIDLLTSRNEEIQHSRGREGAVGDQNRREILRRNGLPAIDLIMAEAERRSPGQRPLLFANIVAELEARHPRVRVQPDDQIEIVVREPSPAEFVRPIRLRDLP